MECFYVITKNKIQTHTYYNILTLLCQGVIHLPFYNGKEYNKNKKGVFRHAEIVTDFQGVKHQIDITSKDFDTFVEKLRKLEFEIFNGITTINGNTTVERWAYEWLNTYKKPKVIEKSYNRYK